MRYIRNSELIQIHIIV